VADLAASVGAWFHVDAAYGGGALCSPRTRPLFDGIERADSVTVDPHKWLFAPYDCAAILYRDPPVARAAFTQRAEYLDPVNEASDWNPSDYGPHLSRRARGLPFWFSVATHGTDAYRDAVDRTLDCAWAAARAISDAEHLELLMEPELSVLLFRRIGWGPEDYRAWSRRLLDDQVGFVVPTTWDGETVGRICIVNPRTTVEDVLAVLPD
jgi:glutamate/tyrosine decarboxylase-like PLP-dependent enzyme